MLISPVLGPIYGFAVSVSLGRIRDALKALYSLSLLAVSIVAVAAAAALVADVAWGLEAAGEAAGRAEPGVTYLAVAVLLGGAGAIAVVEGEHEALAGVAIAAALVPPAAAAGMGLGLRLPGMATRASLLVAENIVGMMAGSLIAIQLLGLEPRRYYDRRAARTYLARTAAVLAVLALLLILILV
ncbi:MAG: DUF389 domain-containing protein, partial [Candidatus Korarchaeota archaeon]|nr:DUF389 domain-containing protein [Candidatus Korarchaeota archaeon]